METGIWFRKFSPWVVLFLSPSVTVLHLNLEAALGENSRYYKQTEVMISVNVQALCRLLLEEKDLQ